MPQQLSILELRKADSGRSVQSSIRQHGPRVARKVADGGPPLPVGPDLTKPEAMTPEAMAAVERFVPILPAVAPEVRDADFEHFLGTYQSLERQIGAAVDGMEAAAGRLFDARNEATAARFTRVEGSRT